MEDGQPMKEWHIARKALECNRPNGLRGLGFPDSADADALSLKTIFDSLPLIQYELRPGVRPGLNFSRNGTPTLDQVNIRAVENKAIVEHCDSDGGAAA
jgi:hypothetical protein